MRGRPASRRAEVSSYVHEIYANTGIAPSYGMICAALRIGTRQEVCRIVQALEKDGTLKRVGSGKVRRIQLASPLVKC